jgi:ATP-dependent DNA ligase
MYYCPQNNVKLVPTIPTTIIHNAEKAKERLGECMAHGYEGLVLRHTDGEYAIGKRSPDLFKYKEFQDKECKIVDVWEDKNGNAMFTCLFDHTNAESSFNCTPKRSHEERKLILKNKEDYIGKWLTVKYQDLTDDNLPTFPVGLDLRDCDDDGGALN